MAISIRKYKIFHFVIMLYLVAAFSWWAILLFKKTTEIHGLKNQLAQYENIDQAASNVEYEKQKKMIFGEGLFFGLSILLGLVFIYRAFWAEIKVNKRLNNFLLSVTHELKTPVASLHLINRTLATKELQKSKQKELLDLSYDESLRLESLVDNILTAAKIESSYEFNMEAANISELVNKRVKRFKNLNPERHFILKADTCDTIHIDQEAIIKVVDNLLDNAIKYSLEGAPINIILNSINNSVQLQIIDQGAGIDEKEKRNIFKKFYRIGNEDTRETKGTGLGLFIVKEIIDAHNGHFIIENNLPQGSIFKISLPI